MSFYADFVQKLMNSGFKCVQNLYDSEEITEKSKYIGLVKPNGDAIYAVVLINTDNESHYVPIYNQIEGFFKQHFDTSYASRLILLGVFVSNNPDDNLKNFCTCDIDCFDNDFTQIKWIADTGTGKRIVCGHQPDKVLDIGKSADLSFGGEANNTTISKMRTKASENEKKLLKSSDCMITLILLSINLIIFGAMEISGGSQNTNVLLSFGALEKNLVLSGQWYRLFTYMFLHIGLLHLLGNSLSLYILGSRTERYYGKLCYIIIYIFSGLAAALVSLVYSDAVSAGASGAIFGLMGAMVMYTVSTGRTMDGFDLHFVLIFSIVGMGSGVLMPNVNNAAHAGGFAAGLIISAVILAVGRIKNRGGGNG